MKSPLCFLCVMLLMASALKAEPVPAAAPPQVRIEIQMVVSQTKGLHFDSEVPHGRPDRCGRRGGSADDRPRRSGIGRLRPEVTTVSGQRATTEDIEEVRYATDVPVTELSEKKPPSQLKSETRNAGVTMEVDPTIDVATNRISLTLVPQQVRFVGWREAFMKMNANGTVAKALQPLFATMKVTTSLSLYRPQYICSLPSASLEMSSQWNSSSCAPRFLVAMVKANRGLLANRLHRLRRCAGVTKRIKSAIVPPPAFGILSRCGEMADATDLKSVFGKPEYGFESHHRQLCRPFQ